MAWSAKDSDEPGKGRVRLARRDGSRWVRDDLPAINRAEIETLSVVVATDGRLHVGFLYSYRSGENTYTSIVRHATKGPGDGAWSESTIVSDSRSGGVPISSAQLSISSEDEVYAVWSGRAGVFVRNVGGPIEEVHVEGVVGPSAIGVSPSNEVLVAYTVSGWPGSDVWVESLVGESRTSSSPDAGSHVRSIVFRPDGQPIVTFIRQGQYRNFAREPDGEWVEAEERSPNVSTSYSSVYPTLQVDVAGVFHMTMGRADYWRRSRGRWLETKFSSPSGFMRSPERGHLALLEGDDPIVCFIALGRDSMSPSRVEVAHFR